MGSLALNRLFPQFWDLVSLAHQVDFLRQRGISAKLLQLELRIHPPLFLILRSLASHKHSENAALWTEPGVPLTSGSPGPLLTRSVVTWVEPRLPLGKSQFLSSLFCNGGMWGREP